jgi:hypothetical protein
MVGERKLARWHVCERANFASSCRLFPFTIFFLKVLSLVSGVEIGKCGLSVGIRGTRNKQLYRYASRNSNHSHNHNTFLNSQTIASPSADRPTDGARFFARVEVFPFSWVTTFLQPCVLSQETGNVSRSLDNLRPIRWNVVAATNSAGSRFILNGLPSLPERSFGVYKC